MFELLDEGVSRSALKQELLREFDTSFVEDVLRTFSEVDSSTALFRSLTSSEETFTSLLQSLPQPVPIEETVAPQVKQTLWQTVSQHLFIHYKTVSAVAVVLLLVLVSTAGTGINETDTNISFTEETSSDTVLLTEMAEEIPTVATGNALKRAPEGSFASALDKEVTQSLAEFDRDFGDLETLENDEDLSDLEEDLQ